MEALAQKWPLVAQGGGNRRNGVPGRTDLAEGIFVAPHLICQVVGIYC